ncbi:MAG TPA: RagB/SusD family nutrient uptake outer membrane protein [Flavisolibacter sp.]|nr:RagB/SusD family nutrient uptake outer membrane protein [Flavisolibacter sp.]
MKSKYLSIALIATIGLTSCKKELDLKDPQGLDPQAALATDANIKRVLQGGYDALSSSSMYGGNIQMFADLAASDGQLNWVGTFNTYREVWGKSIITTNPIIRDVWGAGYNAINIANNVIANIGKVAAADQARIKGEALFIRGAMHFELVRFFAKDYTDGDPTTNPGIPIMKQPTNASNEITKPSRAKVAEVYAAVIADLIEAESLLPATNGVYATKSAAAAILSRAYLQKADYAGARDAASRAITSATGKSLLPTFMNNFNQAANTAEDIFAIQVSDQDGANNLQLFYSVDIFGARDGDIEVEPTYLSLYEATDVRRSSTNNPGATTSFNTAFYVKYGAYRTTKWRDLYKNVKVIRLAELYLTRAEANFRLGTSIGDTPLNDINRIRNRSSATPFAALTLNDFYDERRRELAFEGFGLHDAKRFKKTIDGLPWNDNKLVFPIPFRELNANASLTQNAGY